jgi:hypothetical protein
MFNKLFLIKFVHSLIFWWQAACLGYILYAGICRDFNLILVAAVCSIFINGVLLLLNNSRCPFTTLAERQGAESGSVTDIFLPDFIARNIFKVSFPFFVLELIFLAVRYFLGI